MANMSLEECYRILELPNGATLVEAQAAYRKLVRVWHPDRFASLPDLKADAETKLNRLSRSRRFDLKSISATLLTDTLHCRSLSHRILTTRLAIC